MFRLGALLGSRPSPFEILRPRFACAGVLSAARYRDRLKLAYDPYIWCKYLATEQSSPVHSFYAEGTSYIFLCDSILKIDREPKAFTASGVPSECPSVDLKRNMFQGDQYKFHRRYQIFSVIHSLTRLYLGGDALDANTDPIELFDWNDCVFTLNDETSSVLNPTNLELYVASRYPPLL